jgi:hypothetical protein
LDIPEHIAPPPFRAGVYGLFYGAMDFFLEWAKAAFLFISIKWDKFPFLLFLVEWAKATFGFIFNGMGPIRIPGH